MDVQTPVEIEALAPYGFTDVQSNQAALEGGTTAELTDRLACEDILKFLSNDTRLAVVERLLAGPKTVGELNERLLLDKTLLSHHLKTLRVNRVVETTREGKWIRYRLSSLIRPSEPGSISAAVSLCSTASI